MITMFVYTSVTTRVIQELMTMNPYLKILVESELFVTQNVDIGVAYLCLKYDGFYHDYI